ncbi:ESPR domain-containing protein, partial [Leclercia adecarboxylata]
MNRIYRKVWNKALGQMVVASELASSQSSGVVIDQRRTSGGRNTA